MTSNTGEGLDACEAAFRAGSAHQFITLGEQLRAALPSGPGGRERMIVSIGRSQIDPPPIRRELELLVNDVELAFDLLELFA